MDWALLNIWTSTIPSAPLVFGHSNLIWMAANALLTLCAVALWFERERTFVPAPLPLGHDDDHEHRLAA